MQVYHFKDKTDELDHQFAEYLKGKRVAVVGCAALDDMEQGDFIDSHDVVVRIHATVPYSGYAGHIPRSAKDIYSKWEQDSFVPREWQSRVGRRVNVFYHKECEPWRMQNMLKLFQAGGGTFLCREFWADIHIYQQVEINKMMPCRYLTTEHNINTMAVVQNGIHAGTQMIADILRHDIGSLYLTGFPTFFERDGSFIATADRWRREMSFYNLDWLRQLCFAYDEISVDPNMFELFDIMPNTWDKYKNG